MPRTAQDAATGLARIANVFRRDDDSAHRKDHLRRIVRHNEKNFPKQSVLNTTCLPPSAGLGQALSSSFCLQITSRLWSPQQRFVFLPPPFPRRASLSARQAHGRHPVPREEAGGQHRSHQHLSDAETPSKAQLQRCNWRTANFSS